MEETAGYDSDNVRTDRTRKVRQSDLRGYQRRYHRLLKKKLIAFNPARARDMLIWQHLRAQPNSTGYIKSLIWKDILRKGSPPLFLSCNLLKVNPVNKSEEKIVHSDDVNCLKKGKRK